MYSIFGQSFSGTLPSEAIRMTMSLYPPSGSIFIAEIKLVFTNIIKTMKWKTYLFEKWMSFILAIIFSSKSRKKCYGPKVFMVDMAYDVFIWKSFLYLCHLFSFILLSSKFPQLLIYIFSDLWLKRKKTIKKNIKSYDILLTLF